MNSNNTLLIWFATEYFDIQYVNNTIKLDWYNYYLGSRLGENDILNCFYHSKRLEYMLSKILQRTIK